MSTDVAHKLVSETKPSSAGTWSTQSLRPWNAPQLKNEQQVQLPPKKIPDIAVGIAALDIDASRNLRLTADAKNVTPTEFTVSMNSWADTTFYSGYVTYLELGHHLPGVQTGRFNTTEVNDWTKHIQNNSKRIEFKRAYHKPPKVICWLNSLDFDKGANFRIQASISDINETGFTAHINTWSDTIMYSGGLTWLAHPADNQNYASGKFDTNEIRAWNNPQQQNQSSLSFSRPFDGTPNVVMALNSFDYQCGRNLRLALECLDVSSGGLKWKTHAWADSIMYQSGGQYFAWLSDDQSGHGVVSTFQKVAQLL